MSDLHKIHVEKLWPVSVRVRNVLRKIRLLSVPWSNNYCGSASVSVCSPHTSAAHGTLCHCWQTSRALSTPMHGCGLHP